MIDTEKQLLLPRIRHERGRIVPAALQFQMLGLVDVVDTRVDLVPRGCGASNLLAQEEVRVLAQDSTASIES